MLTHMSPRTNQSQSLGRGSSCVVGICSVILTIISFFGGFELSVATAWSEAATAVEMVNRTAKADRLPLASVSQLKFLKPPAPNQKLLDGCESVASSLVRSPVARVAGRCLS
jgi:hypothetical protein